MSGCLWINGRIVGEDQFCIRAGDRGMLYGDGLFETVRLYRGKPFVLEQHCARLKDGCTKLNISYPEKEIESGIKQVLENAGHLDGSLRITVTRGESSRGILPPSDTSPTVIIKCQWGDVYSPVLYERGFRAVTISFPRNHLSPLVRLKTLNYLENVLGRMEAANAGVEEGIFLNFDGDVAEGTVSNVFLVLEEGIATPPLESGLLPGITRDLVIMLALQSGLNVSERPVRKEDFARATEAFLTNSLLEVMPLVSLDGKPVGNGRPGPVSVALRHAYHQYVEDKVFA